MTSNTANCIEIETVRIRRAEPRHSPLPAILLGIFVPFWLALAISPVSRQDWLLENLLVLVAVPALVVTSQRLRFSNGAYLCLSFFLVFHSIGAHYTYALVPYDSGWQSLTGSTFNELFGWQRNHYDRLVHFLYGVLMLPAATELFERYTPLPGIWRWLIPFFFVASHGGIYEIVEWIAAIIVAPDLGNAYLGTQGDPWDAQWDMAWATAGAALSALILCVNAEFTTTHRR